SIKDVYAFVNQIGAKEPGTLAEPSIFSHAYYEGPILVNSSDSGQSIARDPDDKDGRYKKDFIPPDMLAKDLALFQKAFASGGSIWIWGCDASKVYAYVFDKVAKTQKYKTTAPGKLRDTHVFTFEFTQQQATSLYHQDSEFFPAKSAKGSYPLK